MKPRYRAWKPPSVAAPRAHASSTWRSTICRSPAGTWGSRLMDKLKAKIRHIPDFPKPGILFYDITTLLNDPEGFRETIAALAAPYRDMRVEQVVGIESRGFILGAAVAGALGAGFVP